MADITGSGDVTGSVAVASAERLPTPTIRTRGPKNVSRDSRVQKRVFLRPHSDQSILILKAMRKQREKEEYKARFAASTGQIGAGKPGDFPSLRCE
jgi:hypothetical protein